MSANLSISEAVWADDNTEVKVRWSDDLKETLSLVYGNDLRFGSCWKIRQQDGLTVGIIQDDRRMRGSLWAVGLSFRDRPIAALLAERLGTKLSRGGGAIGGV